MLKEREAATRDETEQARIRADRGRTLAWCDGCGAQVHMLTAFNAAALAGVSSYDIYRWAEKGAIHFGVTAEGALLVCPHSLARMR